MNRFPFNARLIIALTVVCLGVSSMVASPFGLAQEGGAKPQTESALTRKNGKQNQKSAPSAEKLPDPVTQDILGWTVFVDPAMLKGEHAEGGAKALKMLESHLFFITLLVPEQRLAELKTLKIWIEHQHPTMTNMAYHPSGSWLVKNGHDPRLEKMVHIPVASQLLNHQQLMKHPMVVMHELAHSYHDQFLGFNDKRVLATFKSAKSSGRYESVLDHRGEKVRHYALNNHKEYFAESTEAYFNRNDFYPFVNGELKEFDPDMHALMKEIWGF
ncbi:MAG: metallopeptidase [Planctomycetota bacterium]